MRPKMEPPSAKNDELVFNIPDYADIAEVELGIRMGDYTCSHYIENQKKV